MQLVDDILNYISYDGGLTTPPCTQGVKWILLRERKPVFDILYLI